MPKRKSAGVDNQGNKRPTMPKRSSAAGQTPKEEDFIEQLGRERDAARVQASKSVATSVSTDGVADRLISWSKESHKTCVHKNQPVYVLAMRCLAVFHLKPFLCMPSKLRKREW